MKNSLVSHPEKQPLILARSWQFAACGGCGCAALLLNYFEYWHVIKLEQIKYDNDVNNYSDLANNKLMQYHTVEHLRSELFFMFGKDAITNAVQSLQKLGFISIHSNPFTKADRTRHFVFHPDVVNDWIVRNGKLIRDYSKYRNMKILIPEIGPSNVDMSDLHSAEIENAKSNIRNTVKTEITSKIPPVILKSGADDLDLYWTISLPKIIESGRDALVAAARKHRRNPEEMRAAAVAALAFAKANDFVSLAISKLKDPDWIAPPASEPTTSKNCTVQTPPDPIRDWNVARENIQKAISAATKATNSLVTRPYKLR